MPNCYNDPDLTNYWTERMGNLQQWQAHQNYYQNMMNQLLGASLYTPAPIGPPPPPDEFAWLRGRVEEICWRAA